jgi:hypothetical protein
MNQNDVDEVGEGDVEEEEEIVVIDEYLENLK